jgi:molybdopterin-guanine dinucleotide biosynthesis protein A
MPGSARPTRAVSGAILAGGRARRFGGLDKWALVVGGRRIIDHQLDALRAVTDDIVIVGHAPERFAGLAIEVAGDLVPGAGPLGGLYTALRRSAAPLVLVLACDLPFVTGAVLAHLASSIGDAEVCVPRDAHGLHPLCACYAARCAVALEERLRAGQYRMTDALGQLARVEVDARALAALDPTGRALVNLNTAGDYAAFGPPAHHDTRPRS